MPQSWEDAYDEVADGLGVANDATLVTRLSAFFNAAARRISRKFDWEFLKTKDDDALTMVAGTSVYDLPTDFKKVISVYYDETSGAITELTDRSSLTDARWREEANVSTDSDDRDTPTDYRILTWDDEDASARVFQIELSPVPDAAAPADVLGVEYFRYINTLTSTTAIIAYPDDFIELVKKDTYYHGALMLKDRVTAAMYKDDFKTDLEDAKNQQGMKRSGPVRMQNVFSQARRTRQARRF
jgi:hypothetical protein